MRIIPAIDIIDGKCVRLSQGDYNTQKIYSHSPLEVARQFEDSGITHLHLVDLDGAKSKRIINYKALETIASRTNLKIDFGGGIRSNEDLHIAFNSGARQISCGSIAIKEPKIFEEWITKYGGQKIILGADSKYGKIAINGWADNSDKEVIPYIKDYQLKGIQYVICTDIARDGMLEGPAFELYRTIIKSCTNASDNQSVRLIASGGVSSLEDIYRLKQLGCEGVIIGKALYEQKISLKDLETLI